MAVIDAEGAVVGRLSARVSKLLLSGEPVEIINAEKAVMTGSLIAAKEKYFSRRSQKNKRNPEESPKWPRIPNLFLRRIVRGMLPYKSKRGRDAYHKLKVLCGAKPDAKPIKIKEADSSGKSTFTLLELCRQLGFSGKV